MSTTPPTTPPHSSYKSTHGGKKPAIVARQPEPSATSADHGRIKDKESPTISTEKKLDQSAAALRQLRITNKAVSGRKKDSTFLGIPTELRDMVYRYLFVIDQGPEFVPDRKMTKNFAFGVLGVNRKIREEALRVCLKENTWIYIVFKSSEAHKEADRKVLGNLAFRHPQAQLRLREKDMSKFCHEHSLRILIGPRLDEDLVDERHTTPQNDDLCFRILVAYSQRAFAYFCHDLTRLADLYKNMFLYLGREYPMNAADRKLKIMFPLSLVFGLTTFFAVDADKTPLVHPFLRMMAIPRTWPQILQIPAAWESAGDRAVATKNYAQAVHFYDCGQDACFMLSTVCEKLHIHPTWLERNEWASLGLDLASNLSIAINKLVESRRVGPERRISGVSLRQLHESINESGRGLWWPGILERQRHRAHFQRAIAYRNRAEWEVQHATGTSDARRYLEEAAKDFFYADQVEGPFERRPDLVGEVNRALGREETTMVEAPLSPVFVREENVVLHLDRRLLQVWSRDVLPHIHLMRRRPVAPHN